ncbi:MFS transporter [Actinocrispum sp. NPDC049592]|uniref:MFS transporter n=1 Tax=Actinocrispum sp. NPDC049592 TaxID=3154835 RepID=UPI00342C94B5
MTYTLVARPAASPARWRVGHGGGFWVIAAAFTAALAFSTLPTPLYSLYQQRDGFPTFVITVIFAAYAVGVMASLYLAGHVSDWLGRRRVIVAAVLAEALSAVLFLTWMDVPGLIVARLVSGIGIGALTATATAHLSELRVVSRPSEDGSRSGLVSSVANMGGLALGPVIGGVLAQYVTSPLTVPYLVFLFVLLAMAIAVSLVPETVERQEERPAYRPQRVSLPSAARPTFFAATTGALAVFAIMGLFTALAPTLLNQVFHQPSKLLGGIVTTSVLGASAVSQIVFAQLARRTQLKLGIALTATGLVVIPVAALAGVLWLFMAGGIVAGMGVGLGFRAAVGTAAMLADPATRGEVLAAFFLGAYMGLVLPVLAIGLALIWLPSTTVVLWFAAVELVVIAWAGRRTLATV